LLDSPTPNLENISKLPVHLLKRIREVWNIEEFDKVVKRVEEHYSRLPRASDHIDNASDDLKWDLDAYGTDPERSKAGRQSLLTAVSNDKGDLSLELAQRSILHLVSYPVRLQFDLPKVVASDQAGPLLFAKLDVPWIWENPIDGTVDFIYDTYWDTQAIVLSIGHQIIFQHLSHALTDQPKLQQYQKQFSEYIIAHRVRDEESRKRSSQISAHLASHPAGDGIRSFLQDLTQTRNEEYTKFALWWVRRDRYSQCVEAMGRRGLLDLLGPRLLKSVVILSMLDTLQAFLEEVSLATGHGNVQDECAELESLCRKTFGRSILMRRIESDGARTGTRVIIVV
jgi:hypothetical protein